MGLNASKVKSTGGSSNTPILEAGNYPARLVQLIDLGLQARKPWKGKDKPPVNQLWVTYELPTEFMLDEDGNDIEDKPRWISEKMNLFSLSQDNATSTKRITALDPKNDLEGDWGQALGFPCTLTVVQSKDGKYANIGGISPPMKGLTIGDLVNDAIIFDLDSPDVKVFNDLPDFLQEMVVGNLDYAGSALQKALGKDAPKAKAKPTPTGGQADGSQVDDAQTDDAPY